MLCKAKTPSLKQQSNPARPSSTPILDGSYYLQISRSIAEVEAPWQEALDESSSFFLDPAYLAVLEKHPPQNMCFYYLLFWKGERLCGLAYVQDMPFRPAGYATDEQQQEQKGFRQWVKKQLTMPCLVCGNLLLTGQHGFCFPGLDASVYLPLIEAALNHIRQSRPNDSRFPPLQVYKDYVSENYAILQEQLKEKKYTPIKIQPAMRLAIRPHWRQFDDYLTDMKSKYRVRARRAAKKGKDFERRALSLTEVQALEERMYSLYLNIAERADYNGFLLHPQYFTALLQALPEQVTIFGYFLEGELVAFYTTVFNKKELEAHFLGFEPQLNASHQVYLNILYDLVRSAIYHQKESLHFARTALAIKSSVGAVPQAMTLFMRQSSGLLNQLLRPTFHWLHDEEEWIQRHPFKG